MKKCTKCGGGIPDSQKYCTYCGTKIEPEQPATTQAYTNIGTQGNSFGTDTPPTEIKIGKAPKISGGKQILISVFAVVIVVIVSAVGGKLLANYVEMGDLRGIEEYIEKIDNYVPGTMDENGYSSEYWNMRIDFGKDWIAGDEEDVAELDSEFENMMEEAFSSMFDELDPYSTEAELVRKSMHSQAEAMAYLMDDDDIIIAQLNVLSWGVFGIDEGVAEDMVSGVSSSGGVDSYPMIIAGRKVKRHTVENRSEDIFIDTFYIEQDGIIMMLQLTGLIDHMNEARSIYRQIDTY